MAGAAPAPAAPNAQGWEAFGGPPHSDMWNPANFGLTPSRAPQGHAQPPASGTADSWDLFGPPGDAASALVSQAVAVPQAAAKTDWSIFGGAPDSEAAKAAPPPQVQQQTQQTARTGILPNMAAGMVEGGGGVLNIMSDPFGNLIGKPLSMLAVTGHDALAPVFGYSKFTPEQRAALLNDTVPQIGTQAADAIGRAVGAPPVSSVQPANALEEMARAGTAGAVGMMGLGAAAGPATVGRLIGNAALGGSGGVTGNLLGRMAPEEYRPAAELAGNILGASVPASVAAIGRGAMSPVADYMAPVRGRTQPLAGDVGPIMGADGVPLSATARQAEMAGQRLVGAATDPAAVRATLDAPPAPLVPGVDPTVAQITRDPGLMQLERGISRPSTEAAAAFRTRADAQNDARVGAVRGIADGADPAAVPVAVQRLAGETDAAASARVQAVQQQADAAREAMGGNLPAGSEGTLGQMLRQPLAESLAATRKRESGLWNAIDPNGTLAVDMTPIRAQAHQIAANIGPNAAPLAGDEAALMGTAATLPDVQSFRDLTDLRSRITDQKRAADQDPARAREVARLSQLLRSVHDAMEGSVAGQAAQDAAAVQAGTMPAEQAMMGRVQTVVDRWRAERNAQSATGTAGPDSASGSGLSAGSGAASIPGLSRAGGQTNGRLGSAAGYQGGPSQPPLTPNFDAAAAARYADARQATADRVATYRNAPGVGQVLQQGQSGFRTPDSAVPNIIVKTGPQGADAVRSYTAAGGSPQALSDAAAYSLRQFAGRPDGTIDPARFQTWAGQRSSFLSELPDAANRFRTAAQAQTAVDDSMAARAQVAKQIQGSALGKFMGDADPVTQVASVLRSPSSLLSYAGNWVTR